MTKKPPEVEHLTRNFRRFGRTGTGSPSLEPGPTLVDMVTTESRRHHINKGWAWFEAMVAPPVWRVCFHDVSLTKHHSVCTRSSGTYVNPTRHSCSSQTSARKLVRNNQIQMNWLIINLKDTPAGRKLITWPEPMQYKYRKKKKKDQRKEWVEAGKMRRREKVWCHENWALFKDLLIEKGGSSILTVANA